MYDILPVCVWYLYYGYMGYWSTTTGNYVYIYNINVINSVWNMCMNVTHEWKRNRWEIRWDIDEYINKWNEKLMF